MAWPSLGQNWVLGFCGVVQQGEVGPNWIGSIIGIDFQSLIRRTTKYVSESSVRPFVMGDVPAKDSELRRAYVEAQALL